MKVVRPHLRTATSLSASVLACAVGLSACGGFDSAATGNAVIKQFFKKYGQGKVVVKSSHCPGGVKEQTGGSYTCNVVLTDKTTNKDHSGTITIHMTSGNVVRMTGQDINVQ